MPKKTESSKKALRVSNRRREYNSKIKKELKTIVNRFRRERKKEDYGKIVELLDGAASKNIIHKNTAGRLKSRLLKLLKKEKTQEPEKPKAKVKKIKKTKTTKKTKHASKTK